MNAHTAKSPIAFKKQRLATKARRIESGGDPSGAATTDKDICVEGGARRDRFSGDATRQ
jgi:hypothetical protein